MHQFFVEETQVKDKEIQIIGADVNHIRNVLRMKLGEQFRVSVLPGIHKSDSADYFCEITDFRIDTVLVRILYQDRDSGELPVAITLFQGLPKSDKMEFVIQKAVELGVAEIVPVAMKNCVVKLDQKKATAKCIRWQGIAQSAAKQARRSRIPKILPMMNFQEAADYAKTLDLCLLPYENERGMEKTRQLLASLKKEGSLGIFIGPEGGFDESEIARMRGNAEVISLGKRILRTETAGMVMLSMLLYCLEE
ncbi:ribosomal RNA small subunit methyltransferase E [Clostridia bacterium]|nr:ribosomal RNA small subunit methyltransferase E [Clostridia bacterium]